MNVTTCSQHIRWMWLNHTGGVGCNTKGDLKKAVWVWSTIIAHPSLISHSFSPSLPTEGFSPCNYYHSRGLNWRNWIFWPSKMINVDLKKGMEQKKVICYLYHSGLKSALNVKLWHNCIGFKAFLPQYLCLLCWNTIKDGNRAVCR